MKKGLVFAAAALISASAFSQTVSANIVGYVKVDKPGNSELNIMGIPFITANGSNDLNTLVDITNFSGDSVDPAVADQIITWNASIQEFTTYALYEIAGFPQYTSWQLFDEFGYGADSQNPILPAGSAVFVRGSGADTNVVQVGQVVLNASATNNIVEGLQLVSNPFSESVHLTNLAFTVNGTISSVDPAAADQIIAWDPDTQTYTTFALYGIDGLPEYTQWMYFDNFTYGAPEPDFTFNSGIGFWYRAQNDFTWVETNKYLSNL